MLDLFIPQDALQEIIANTQASLKSMETKRFPKSNTTTPDSAEFDSVDKMADTFFETT